MTYLDTHAALWLCSGEVPLSEAALQAIDTDELRISPGVLMELQFLQEVGRVNAAPAEWLRILQRDFEVAICPIPFYTVTQASYSETWTRDPFDRLIVAQAKAGEGKLVTRDRRIHDHFANALW